MKMQIINISLLFSLALFSSSFTSFRNDSSSIESKYAVVAINERTGEIISTKYIVNEDNLDCVIDIVTEEFFR